MPLLVIYVVLDILLYGAFRDFSGVSGGWVGGWVAGSIEIRTNSAQLGVGAGAELGKKECRSLKLKLVCSPLRPRNRASRQEFSQLLFGVAISILHGISLVAP